VSGRFASRPHRVVLSEAGDRLGYDRHHTLPPPTMYSHGEQCQALADIKLAGCSNMAPRTIHSTALAKNLDPIERAVGSFAT
jgi:hypothetical protein